MNGYANHALKRFNYLLAEIDAVYHEMAKQFGLSDTAMNILYAICVEGECCLLSDICRLFGTSKQTINSALRKLEQAGMVYLEAVDNKKKTVCLTEQGKVLAERTVRNVIEAENAVLDGWSVSERQQYLALTARFLMQIREYAISMTEEDSHD